MQAKHFGLVLPHEHGAWAMFFVPLVVGIGVGLGRLNADSSSNVGAIISLFGLTAVGFFLVRYPLMLWVKARDANVRYRAACWSGLYGALMLVGGTMLVIFTQLWWLALLGFVGGVFLGIYLWLVARRAEMTTVGEWLGIAGAALAAPGAYLVLTRSLDLTALMLYGLNVFFFGGTVYYIKFKVRVQPKIVLPGASASARLFAARMPILYHLIVLAMVAACAFIGWVPGLVIAAYLLPMFKVMLGALDRPARSNVPRLGMIEVVYALAFTLLILAAYR